MKNQLDNDNALLEIWSSDGNTKIEDTDKMATGMIVKLVINGEVKDQKTVVVIGDINGDGIITLPDAVQIMNHYLQLNILEEIKLIAADVNKDSNVTLPDAVMVVNHYLGTVKLS
jgi:hypothetical protein